MTEACSNALVERPGRGNWTATTAASALLCALAVGVAVDQAMTTNPIGLAGTLAALIAIGGVIVVARPRGSALRWLLMGAALTPWIALRTSPWLIGPDLLAIAALLVLAAASTGRQAPSTFLGLLARQTSLAGALVRSPMELTRAARVAFPSGSPQRRATLVRGAALALPLAVAIAALLASGDRLFASLLGSVGLGTMSTHALSAVVAAAAWFPLALRSREVGTEDRAQRLAIGGGEGTMILGAVAVVLAAYVASTAAGTVAGRRYIENRTGLTFAQYARSGFFQLIGVVAIVVAVIVTLRPLGEPGTQRRRLMSLGLLALTLTATIVVLSIARLLTYRTAYGLTMLRFSTTVFAAWLGFVVFALGVTLVSSRLRRSFVAVVVASAFVTLMAVNAVNPEAVVARENIGRIGRLTAADDVVIGTPFDGMYLEQSLSDDATPTIIARLDAFPDDVRTRTIVMICAHTAGGDGWSWNAARARAARARHRVCTT